jgi:pentatricopeptide repeat protein
MQIIMRPPPRQLKRCVQLSRQVRWMSLSPTRCSRTTAPCSYKPVSKQSALTSRAVPTLKEESSSNQIIDLKEEYEKTISKIVLDHLEVFQDYFGIKHDCSGQVVSDELWNDDILESDHLIDSVCSQFDDLRVLSITRRCVQKMNEDYFSVRAERTKVHRMRCPTSLYNKFLRQLYRMDGVPNPVQVFDAYRTLPYPPPRYIDAEHLEDLIAFYMGGASARNPSMYLTILGDIAECKMPISAREHCAAMHFLGKWLRSPSRKKAWPLLEERINSLKQLEPKSVQDAGALNVLLGIALASKQEHLLSELKAVKPDRFTIMVYLSYYTSKRNTSEVQNQYRAVVESGLVVDISLLNLITKAFLACGFVHEAETILQKLVGSQWKVATSQKFARLSPTRPKLRDHIQMMDFLLDILRTKGIDVSKHQYTVPVIPDYYTYGNFFGYYCMKSGDFVKALEIIKIMTNQGCPPDQHFFYKLYTAFTRQQSGSGDWTLGRLNYVTDLVCEYELQGQSKGTHFCTTQMARAALKAYRCLFPESSQWDEMEKLLNESPPRHYTVYKLLRKLAETK